MKNRYWPVVGTERKAVIVIAADSEAKARECFATKIIPGQADFTGKSWRSEMVAVEHYRKLGYSVSILRVPKTA